jgi:hypothetical protein
MGANSLPQFAPAKAEKAPEKPANIALAGFFMGAGSSAETLDQAIQLMGKLSQAA